MTIHDTETLGSRSTHMSAWKQAPVLLKEADEAKLNRGNQKNPPFDRYSVFALAIP